MQTAMPEVPGTSTVDSIPDLVFEGGASGSWDAGGVGSAVVGLRGMDQLFMFADHSLSRSLFEGDIG